MNFFKLTLSTFVAFIFLLATIQAQPIKPPPLTGNSGGENPDPIICHWPPSGNVNNVSTVFKWEPVPGATSYTVSLLNEDGDETIMTANVSATELLLELPNLNLALNQIYNVTVTSQGTVKTSNPCEFTLKSPSDWGVVLGNLESDSQYNSATGIDKALRKAAFFHAQNWNLEASKAYNIPNDKVSDMIKIMGAFDQFVKNLFPEE